MKQPSPIQKDDSVARILIGVLYIANAWLMYELISLHIQGASTQIILATFKYWRNTYYMGYAFLFVVLGISIMAQRKTAKEKKPLIGLVVSHMILTTFSYAFMGVLWDLYTLIVSIF